MFKLLRKVVPLRLIAIVFFLSSILIVITCRTIYRGRHDHRSRTKPKIILLGNSFWGHNWGLPDSTVNESYFISENCPATNCIVTKNRRYLESDLQYDAIVFHTTLKFSLQKMFPERSPHQIYVFATVEPPAYTFHDFKPELDLFNMTMTFRLDSDIFWPYGFLEDLETGKIVAPNKQVRWREPNAVFELDPAVERQLVEKNKTAAWYVSRCGAVSKRDDLVKVLKKHIDVDVYGNCGPLKCKRFTTECDDKLDREYKFYLSFENSLCVDYVTEKFFGMLDRNIVPVVFGGGNYTQFAPPHSYINVEDFKTISDLANYLKYLDGNFTEYRKYFWWKKFYRHAKPIRLCELCKKLNNPATDLQKSHYNPNIKKWWIDGKCRKPEIEFV